MSSSYVYSYVSPLGEERCVTVKMPMLFAYNGNGNKEDYPPPYPCEVIVERDMDNQHTDLSVEEQPRGEYIGKKYKMVFKFVDSDDLYGFCEQIREAMNLVSIAIETKNKNLPKHFK